MAQLSPLIQFTAGTPAVADDVKSNFNAIRNHINGANIDTENIASTLTSRSGGPILFLNQASQNQIALAIQNSQTNTAMQILQSTALADATKAVLKIDSPTAQTTGKAELWLDLAAGSTIPALLVEHDADVTMSLTNTQLNLFNSSTQVTSSNISTTSLVTLTAPLADAIALKLKGRLSDNASTIQLTANDGTTQYSALNSTSTYLNYDVKTGSSHTFSVNGVTKGVIDTNGVDGQYMKTASIPKGKMVALSQQTVTPANFNYLKSGTGPTSFGPLDIAGASITFTSLGRPLVISINASQFGISNEGSGFERVLGRIDLLKDNVVIRSFKSSLWSYPFTENVMEIPVSIFYIDPVAAGTYTYKLQMYGLTDNDSGSLNTNMRITLSDISFTIYEL